MKSALADAPRLLPLGDSAWSIEFGTRIDPALHARVLGLAQALNTARQCDASEWSGIVDIVPTFRSLTVHYDPLRVEGERLGESLLQLASASGKASHQGKHWRIPVCFDADLAPDLDDLAQAKGITREAVIRLLSEARFQVYMIGFMPGFPYMCGLPKALEMPRLASPRQVVPARSLAIANEMCAVYPWESPGGWRLLGRTPIPMFSASVCDAPSLLASGDQVEWQPIDRDRFDELENSVMEGRFMRDSLLLLPGEH